MVLLGEYFLAAILNFGDCRRVLRRGGTRGREPALRVTASLCAGSWVLGTMCGEVHLFASEVAQSRSLFCFDTGWCWDRSTAEGLSTSYRVDSGQGTAKFLRRSSSTSSILLVSACTFVAIWRIVSSVSPVIVSSRKRQLRCRFELRFARIVCSLRQSLSVGTHYVIRTAARSASFGMIASL